MRNPGRAGVLRFLWHLKYKAAKKDCRVAGELVRPRIKSATVEKLAPFAKISGIRFGGHVSKSRFGAIDFDKLQVRPNVCIIGFGMVELIASL